MRQLLAIGLLVVAALFGQHPNPPNSDDEIFLYRALAKAAPGHVPLDQGQIGTCVAAGHAGALDELLAINVAAGKADKWRAASIESIYGLARNEGAGRISRSYSDGSSGLAATRALAKYGVIFRQPYGGVDLSRYEVPRAKDWGAWGNGGKPDGLDGPLDQEAKKHPVESARVKTLDELDVALKNGYPVTVCSGIGFKSPRDADGFCRASGSWSHCMRVSGKRNGGRKGYLIVNSWGAYIDGDGPSPRTKNKYKDQPDGSFYVEPATMQRILSAGDSWALTDYQGFARRLLPTWLTSPDAEAPAELAPRPTPAPPLVERLKPDLAAIAPKSDLSCGPSACRSGGNCGACDRPHTMSRKAASLPTGPRSFRRLRAR